MAVTNYPVRTISVIPLTLAGGMGLYLECVRAASLPMPAAPAALGSWTLVPQTGAPETATSPTDKKSPDRQAEKLEWAESLDAALAAAKKDDKLVFVAVSYGTCGWCQKMDREVYPDAKVAAALKGYVPVREKVGLGLKDGKQFMYKSAFATKHKTAFTPTFYILDSTGEIVDTFLTYHAPPELVARLAQARHDYRKFADLAKRVEEKPEDHAAVGQYAALLAARGRVAEAIACVEKAELAGAGAALAPAYNRIADTYYQALFGGACELYGNFDDYDKGTAEAVRWFKKTVAACKQPEAVAYARYGLATCYGAQGKRKEQNALYDEILAMPGAPAMIREWVEQRRPRKGTP